MNASGNSNDFRPLFIVDTQEEQSVRVLVQCIYGIKQVHMHLRFDTALLHIIGTTSIIDNDPAH